MIVPWLAFPLVLALLSAGLGLLVEWALRTRLPASLVLPCGFALLVVVSSLATIADATAELATPAAILLAVAGIALGARRRAWPFRSAGAAASLAVFAVAAAPVVLTGEATFAGYTQLDDISTFLAFASHAIEHGRDLSGLAPSTFEATLAVNLDTGYPVGAFVPLAAARPLVGQDLAWLWQPYLTFMLAMLALALWSLAGPLVRDARLRALVVFLAAQPALLYAYVLQGAAKEVAAAALLAVAAALGARMLRDPGAEGRLAVPIGIAAAALLCVLNLGAVAYLGPLAVALVAAAALERWSPRRMLTLGAMSAAPLVLALPVLTSGSGFVSSSRGLLQSKTDIGNLFAPLDWKQLFGIWPAGDFRNDIGDGRALALLLIAVLAAAALGGSAWALRRRAFGPLLLAASVIGALLGLALFGDSPWVDAKALAIATPAVVLLAAVGVCALLELSRLRMVGALALVAIAGGVIWSNWLAYRDVKLAPRDRLAELASIGERFAGDGPTLINEYEPYGARYFLRELDPEAPAELRRRVVRLRSGEGLGKNQWAPLDEFLIADLLVYRTIVVRRSPAESRPPAEYALRSSGRYYDVWQRREPPRSRVIAYSIFGDQLNAGAPPPCGLVRRLGRQARAEGGRLVAAVRAPAIVVDLATAERPRAWPSTPGPPAQLYPDSQGRARVTVEVPSAGVYDVWEQGSFARGVELSVDGRVVGSTRSELSFTGQWIRFGSVELAAGRHALELRYPGGSLRPGDGQQPQTLGPVALAPRSPRPALVVVAPPRAAALCARPLDWLEVVAGP